MKNAPLADAFYLEVANALSHCQNIELDLRLYIESAFDFLRLIAKDKMPFKIDRKKFEDQPLGKLIESFKPLTDKTELVADIEKFRKLRNFVAHQAIVKGMDAQRNVSSEKVEEVRTKITELIKLSEKIRQQFGPEFMKLHLARFNHEQKSE